MPLDDDTRLRHMLEAAQAAVSFARGRDRADLDSDLQFQMAVVHGLQLVGEAARHISEEVCKELVEIPWHDIRGLRNRVVHQYFDVDTQIVWDTLQEDIPPLIDALRAYLGAGESGV